MTISIVFGAGGFIGSHLVEQLRKTGHTVYGVDRHYPRFSTTKAHEFFIRDLRKDLSDLPQADEVYQLSAFLGGAGIIDGKMYDADIFMNNMAINVSVLEYCREKRPARIFFSSSACVYAEGSETVQPVNVYGWEKLASEQMYTAFARQYGVDIRIGRLFNIYGSHQEYQGGRERVISALCRKVIQSNGSVAILGNGKPLRTFLHVLDCVRAIRIFMESNVTTPMNIGSSRLISITDVAHIILRHAKKELNIVYSDISDTQNKRACNVGPLEQLGWKEHISLEEGIGSTYDWIATSCATIS
jgi:nucleoside-diphosphate-sugar epimerase